MKLSVVQALLVASWPCWTVLASKGSPSTREDAWLTNPCGEAGKAVLVIDGFDASRGSKLVKYLEGHHIWATFMVGNEFFSENYHVDRLDIMLEYGQHVGYRVSDKVADKFDAEVVKKELETAIEHFRKNSLKLRHVLFPSTDDADTRNRYSEAAKAAGLVAIFPNLDLAILDDETSGKFRSKLVEGEQRSFVVLSPCGSKSQLKYLDKVRALLKRKHFKFTGLETCLATDRKQGEKPRQRRSSRAARRSRGSAENDQGNAMVGSLPQYFVGPAIKEEQRSQNKKPVVRRHRGSRHAQEDDADVDGTPDGKIPSHFYDPADNKNKGGANKAPGQKSNAKESKKDKDKGNDKEKNNKDKEDGKSKGKSAPAKDGLAGSSSDNASWGPSVLGPVLLGAALGIALALL